MRHADFARRVRVLSIFGAFAVLAAIVAAWLVVQIGLYQLWPLDENERTRIAFSLVNYLAPMLMFALPLGVFVGGISMWLGVRTRQPVLVFALPVVIVVGGIFFVWNFNPEWLPSWVDRLMQAVDPTGFRWFFRTYITEDRGVAFYNAQSVMPDTLFAASRVGLVAIGLCAVWATGRRLARTEHADLRVGDTALLLAQAAQADADAGMSEQAAIAARGGNPEATTQAPGFFVSTVHVLRCEARALLRSPGCVVVWADDSAANLGLDFISPRPTRYRDAHDHGRGRGGRVQHAHAAVVLPHAVLHS